MITATVSPVPSPPLPSMESGATNKTTTLSSLESLPTKALVPPGNCQFGENFIAVPLLERKVISPTTSLFRFGLPDATKPLNLSTCSCLMARATMTVPPQPQRCSEQEGSSSLELSNEPEAREGETIEVRRPYTPISTNALVGCFDLLIKNYGPTALMSRHIHKDLEIGDTLEFAHPPDTVKLQAPLFAMDKNTISPKRKKHIVMLAAGTGIAPMIQALHATLGETEDDNDDDVDTATKVTLLYGCRNQEQILAKEMLDRWTSVLGEDRFKVVYVMSREPRMSPWKGERGYIKASRVLRHCPPATQGDDLLIFVCGPPRMYNSLCGPREEASSVTGILAQLGYASQQVYKF